MKILYMVQLTSSLHPQETPYKIQYQRYGLQLYNHSIKTHGSYKKKTKQKT